MNVKIQSVKFDADKKLVDFIQGKMDKMDRFVENALNAVVTLRIDKDDEQGNKVAGVKIEVAGGELLAERRCKTFEEAVDLCLDAIKKQIDKYKEKRR
ncbi:ribosome-associated translation inhibitor RaiA [uncultured Alistipes sp.]|uniref:ribosome hibernation-promoting factor, HPF/YfiA family n=1 Tax=uncultured Alistipes sp. TaxID=538949 RepID=UPI00261CC5C7|nr:ribosome-associated translation inhibitor RaiA [uncultured Alistipes sp.]